RPAATRPEGGRTAKPGPRPAGATPFRLRGAGRRRAAGGRPGPDRARATGRPAGEFRGACHRALANAKDTEAAQSLNSLAATVDRLAGQLRMLQLGADDNDRRRTIDLTAETCAFRDGVEPLLRQHAVRVELEHPAKEVLRANMRPEHFHCLLQI